MPTLSALSLPFKIAASILLLLPGMAAGVQAQDLSGHWVGKLAEVDKRSAYPLILDVQQTGTELQGHITRKTAAGGWVVMRVRGNVLKDRVSLAEEQVVEQGTPAQRWRLGKLTGTPRLVVDTLVMRGNWSGNTTYQKGQYIDTVGGYGVFLLRRVGNRPLPTLAVAARAQPKQPATQTLKRVLFETGKADLVATAQPELDELSQRLQEAPATTVQVAGYTDHVGESAKNRVLSQQRAEVVKRYLISKGVAARRITATGHGDTNLVCPTPCAANQRVEVTLSMTNAVKE